MFLPGHQEGVESGPPVGLVRGLGLQRPPLGSGLKPVPVVSSWHRPRDLALLQNVLAPLPPVASSSAHVLSVPRLRRLHALRALSPGIRPRDSPVCSSRASCRCEARAADACVLRELSPTDSLQPRQLIWKRPPHHLDPSIRALRSGPSFHSTLAASPSVTPPPLALLYAKE
ncbi:unnamed protein product [Rangifer tarandus platyrhynchus]|uniref:Uncharacterized protein n=1 Tax=Rangifer tarandus platyrhynchus TaxID=3082113 RepID=A0AC59ZMT5_RANTA